jgi:hypothetical protein
MTLLEDLLAWCEDERQNLAYELAMMRTNEMHTIQRCDGRLIDTTPQSIERVKRAIAEIDEILARHSSA